VPQKDEDNRVDGSVSALHQKIGTDMLIRKYLFIAFATVFVIHLGCLYFDIVHEFSKNPEEPSIFYSRPMEIRKGDHIGNLRLTERLQRLSYKRVSGKPSVAGTFSEGQGTIRIFSRYEQRNEGNDERGPVEIVTSDGRIVSIVSTKGAPLDLIHLEPEEIGRIMGSNIKSRHPVPLSAISPYLRNAVIATEDARFYSHRGIDLLAIGRALFIDLKEKQFVQGASTITQQLIKNSLLSSKKTLWRKLRELELAIILELRYSKNQIFEMYLNRIYFGQDSFRAIYGIEEAAEFYFSKQAKDLSLDESALLAGIIHAPNHYSLLKSLKIARVRRNEVLTQMRKLKMIQEDEFQRVSKMPLHIQPHRVPAQIASYFTDYILRMAMEEPEGENIIPRGFRYHTTLDPIQQVSALAAVTQGLEEIEKKALPADGPLQAALVAVDIKTGSVTAMIGGRNYGQSPFNRALDARRQPGSAFKPFVLLTALSASAQGKGNKTLSTMISGEPLSIATPEGPWRPSNFEKETYGKITIRKMIEDSVNTATVRLSQDVGIEDVLRTARSSGIRSPLSPVPSMVLGTFDVTPLELAYAYTTIASGGVRFDPYPLYSVTTPRGEILIAKKVQQTRVFDPRVTYLAGYAMQGVLERGTAKSAKALGIYFPASGKTGTTDKNRDSWFVGYTPDVVCAVWVGYDYGADTGLTGADGAFHIWAKFMRALYPKSGPLAVTPPAGIETAVIDPESGYLSTSSCPKTLREAYLTGTAPKETCPLHPVNPIVDTLRKGAHGVWKFFHKLFK
jgi:penicillin-binding protein 1B